MFFSYIFVWFFTTLVFYYSKAAKVQTKTEMPILLQLGLKIDKHVTEKQTYATIMLEK